ncbi:MAG TPA: SIS domain-containing protein [Alphaproteobacteria bacterium]|jgi:D-sedoheptulose 7-phosphate isomerase|nr:SIS domain-containing protein [Alphaproteobacteria bacterium]MCB9984499.1 SIS domain-containing protein [Micavibrio sp.]HPQ50634.1 SIS domain-containing protein [Alphaproteobacteria bacterium]HRK97736.1 SIS domain-containing protein [Alphaproteobacteria bacterium]
MLDIQDFWSKETRHHQDIASQTFATMGEALEKWVKMAVTCIEGGGKILFCGNGGSAADAQHIAAELSVKLCQDRKPIAALCLSLDPSAMTACANDYGYEQIFARQVSALGQSGDMLVGLTTSGNSKNVIEAIEAAKEKGISVVVLTGETGGKVALMADLAIKIPCSDSTARIQEMHILMGHIFCGALEQRLGLL